MEIARRNNFDEGTGYGLIVISIIEFLTIAGMSVLAYILRETEYFPIREVRFRCSDDSLSARLPSGQNTMSQFTYSANISYVLVIVLSFCLPPTLILLGELWRWKTAPQNKLSITLCCAVCKIHIILRRVVRFTSVFIVGILITLIFTDVIKLFVGRLRPNFLEECHVNRTACSLTTSLNDWTSDEICLQSNTTRLRWVRQSFPSMHSSVTAFSSIFMALYWQSVIGHGGRCNVLGPFLSFGLIIMSLMCGLSRYALNYSHWTDVAVGFGLGAAIAVYISVFTLKTFRENDEIMGKSPPDHLPSFETYNTSGFQYQRGKSPWHLTPWHLTAQNNVDTEDKITRLPEAAYYNVDLHVPHSSNSTPGGILRRASLRNPEPVRDVIREDYAY